MEIYVSDELYASIERALSMLAPMSAKPGKQISRKPKPNRQKSRTKTKKRRTTT